MSAVDIILSHLTRVRRSAPGKWIACCPAHDDKHPSLNIRELDDGRLLLKCFGGCSTQEVVGAVGLSMESLFPPRDAKPAAGTKPERRPFIPADVFEIARREIGIAAVISCDMHAQKTVSDDDHNRLLQAVQTLDRIAEVSYAR